MTTQTIEREDTSHSFVGAVFVSAFMSALFALAFLIEA
jgi:hypothetical protein